MSARPRPVTATFKPACMKPPTGVRERRWSLSSGTSTASLVSVLDHDSYESPGSDTEDERVNNDQQNRVNSCNHNANSDQSSRISTNENNTEPKSNKDMSAWEKWLLVKVQDDRKKQLTEIKKKQKQKALIEEEKQVKKEKDKIINAKVDEWISKKNLSEQVRNKMEERQEKTEKELQEAKKKDIEEKSKDNYEAWMSKKSAKEKELKMIERERQKNEEAQKKEKQDKSEVAYNEWCKKNANKVRPKSAHNSFGYTSGKLTGYYDANAAPVPSFYNPIPWLPIHVPKPKTERKKRPKTAYKWNPNKYFN